MQTSPTDKLYDGMSVCFELIQSIKCKSTSKPLILKRAITLFGCDIYIEREDFT